MTAWCARALRDLGLGALADRVKVRWNPRLRSTAGRAHWPEAIIEINPRLVGIHLAEVDRTLRHELAHLVALERAGRRRISNHGPEWRLACRQLGIPDEPACHRLPLPRNQVERRFHYECPGCGRIYPRARRLTRPQACAPCCDAHARGRYDARFRLVPRA